MQVVLAVDRPVQDCGLDRVDVAGAGVVDEEYHHFAPAVGVQHVARQVVYAVQAAALQPGPAGQRRVLEAVALGALQAEGGQRGGKLVVKRLAGGPDQQLGHGAGRDALDAGQAGAVFDHQFGHRQAFFIQPVADRLLTLLPGGRGAEAGRAEVEEQHLGHDVVAVLVGQADDLGQFGRREFHKGLGAGRRFAEPDLAAQAAAHLGPVGLEQRGDGGRWAHQIEPEHAVAAGDWVVAGQFQQVAVAACRQAILPVVASAGRVGLDGVVDRQARRIEKGRDAVRGRCQAQRQGVVVDQQGGRLGVVGLEWFAVELAWVAPIDGKERVVEDDVAVDSAYAPHPDLVHQGPEVLEVQGRVAAALDDEIAGQYAVGEGSRGQHAGLEGVGRAEGVEGGQGGQRLHDRGGVERRVGAEGEHRALPVERLDHHADAMTVQSRSSNGAPYFAWQST